jgi:hypothetical protein
MPASKKDLKKKQKAADAKAGIDRTQKKPENTYTVCQLCKLQLRTTKKNVELKQHWEAKHNGKTFADCFPGEKYE